MKRLFLPGMLICLSCQSFSTPIKDTSISYTDTLEFVSRKGPRNADSSNYATLYFMRPSNTVGESYYFVILVGDEILIKPDNNCRYKIRIHKEGPLQLWSKGDKEKSVVDLDLKFHQDYYVLLEVTPGPKFGNTTLQLLDAAAGKQMYNSITGTEYVVDNPFIINSQSGLSAYRAFFVDNPHKAVQYGLMSFLPPVSLEYYFKGENVFVYNYRDIFVSNTFSAAVTIMRKEVKSLAAPEDVLEYIKKQIKNGKALTSRKEKLVSLSYEPFDGANYFGWMVHYEIQDMDAPNRGNAKFLLMRNTDAWFYNKSGSKKDLLIQVAFSERGLPEEVHLPEEIRFKAFHFIKNVKFTD